MPLFSEDLLGRAAALIEACRQQGLMLATAESCTGGLLAGLLTEIAGASVAFERGFVSYSNEAKTAMLGVPPEILAQHGAVSPETACRMAEGALAQSGAAVAVAITGIAGPGGGSAEKPVGLVYFACARAGAATVPRRIVFEDRGRQAIRLGAVDAGLRLFEEALSGGAAAV